LAAFRGPTCKGARGREETKRRDWKREVRDRKGGGWEMEVEFPNLFNPSLTTASKNLNDVVTRALAASFLD